MARFSAGRALALVACVALVASADAATGWTWPGAAQWSRMRGAAVEKFMAQKKECNTVFNVRARRVPQLARRLRRVAA